MAATMKDTPVGRRARNDTCHYCRQPLFHDGSDGPWVHTASGEAEGGDGVHFAMPLGSVGYRPPHALRIERAPTDGRYGGGRNVTKLHGPTIGRWHEAGYMVVPAVTKREAITRQQYEAGERP